MQPTPSERGAARLAAAAFTALLVCTAPAQALTVFACEPEWAALTRELAPHAQVRSATHARQDPHHIEARPSLIAALRQADLAVCTGAGLEAGWLPTLQQRSGNARVQAGAPGLLLAAEQVERVDARPATASPFAGDVHPEGNPHVHLDPHRVLRVAEALAQRLEQLDPAGRDGYRARWAAWSQDWRRRITAWEQQAAPLRGMRVAVQHGTFAYLWRWLGVQQVADLEPLPGMPPTPGHLQRVLQQTRAAPPRAVVVAAWQDPRAAQWLVQQLGPGARVLQLPATVTGEPPAATLAAWYDHLLAQLLEAAR